MEVDTPPTKRPPYISLPSTSTAYTTNSESILSSQPNTRTLNPECSNEVDITEHVSLDVGVTGPSIPPSPKQRRVAINPTISYHDPPLHIVPPHYDRNPSTSGSTDSDTINEDEEESYDWSDEDDLVDEEAKFNSLPVPNHHSHEKGAWPRSRRVVTFFMSTLIGSTLLSCVLAAIPILLHFFYFTESHPERRYTTFVVSAIMIWLSSNILVSWYIAAIIDLVPAVATSVIDVVWGEVNERFKGRLELYHSAKGWIKPLFYAGEVWVSWVVIFGHIYQLYDVGSPWNSWAPWAPRLYQVVEFFFFLTLLLCLEKLLVQTAAHAFHRTAFQDRINAVEEAIKVIDHLKTYKPKRTHNVKPSVSSTASNGSGLSFWPGFGFHVPIRQTKSGDESGSRPNTPEPASVEEGLVSPQTASEDPYSPKPPRLWLSPPGTPQFSRPSSRNSHEKSGEDGARVAASKVAKALKHAVLHDARNIVGEANENGDAEDNPLAFHVNSAHAAKRLARDIYMAFKPPHSAHRNFLVTADFYPAYPDNPTAAKNAFKVFDKDGNGDVSRADVKTAIVKLYKERRFLGRSLRDVRDAVSTLARIGLVVAFVILFFISLSVFDVNVGQSLTSVYTVAIAASFIFKSSASNAFDAIIFLFVTHPFDTGDRCFIDGENFVVKRMGLFATTFTRVDGAQTYYSNAELLTKFIINARRSGKTWEGLTLQVNWKTPLSKLDELEKCMDKWIESEENRWYEGATCCVLQHIHFQRSLELRLGLGHNGNWQDWTLRLSRKTAFLAAANYYCRQLGITYTCSPQPVVFTDGSTLPLLDELSEGMSPTSPTTPSSLRQNLQPQQQPQMQAQAQTEARPRSQSQSKGMDSTRFMLGFAPPPEARKGLRMRRSLKKNCGKSNM